MIIWRGWGVLALIVGVVVHLVIAFVLEQTLGIPDSAMKAYRAEHTWLWFVGMGLSAVACWFTGVALEKRELKSAKVMVDKETGQDVRLVGKNDLFWIPVKWWALVYAFFAVYFGILGR